MNLAIAIDNLLPSDVIYDVIKEVNKFKLKATDDLTVLIEDVAVPCVDIKAPIMQMYDIFSFYGIVIGTSMNIMGYVNYAPNPAKRIYYMRDYEWCRQRYPFRVLEGFFRSDMDIITSTESQKQLLETTWLRDKEVLGVAPNFDLDKIVSIINERYYQEKANV